MHNATYNVSTERPQRTALSRAAGPFLALGVSLGIWVLIGWAAWSLWSN